MKSSACINEKPASAGRSRGAHGRRVSARQSAEARVAPRGRTSSRKRPVPGSNIWAPYDRLGSKAASRAVHGERLGSGSLRHVLEREMPRTVRWLDQQLATPRTADPVAGLSSVRNKK